MDLKPQVFRMLEDEKVKADYAKGNKYADHLQPHDEEHRSWAFENEFMWFDYMG